MRRVPVVLTFGNLMSIYIYLSPTRNCIHLLLVFMSESKRGRLRRGASRTKMNTAEADIEQASKASDADFIKEYMCPR